MIASLGLRNADYRVETCLSGKEALKLFSESISEGVSSFSLILTDLSMPIMDGYKFSAKCRKVIKAKRVEDPPIIVALTGHTETEFLTAAFNQGID
mmetsp:Transcript_41526/g.63397  ORF Transcript_41526/g.63397 Transcript_41526/m.63397 type:complete len:96 (+) Transcript_41526:1145-1432(+)